eukprot:Nitzschia sp. Nitz4//scaffold123_size70294//8047//8760//NITZ4_005919-RA/size70294-processed-gene-0.2-mRNA-1//1//CDS//3329534458//6663//frame0
MTNQGTVAIDQGAAVVAAKELDSTLLNLLRAGMIANICLLVGGCMFTAFFFHELQVAWHSRNGVQDTLYLLGFFSFFLSGGIEFAIDVRWTRKLGHGRYTTKRRVNLIISAMFLIGFVCDLVAFIFWRQGKEGLREEHLTQWISSHIFLLTAIVVIITNRPSLVPFQNSLDSVANIFFLCETLMACSSRYVSTVGDTKKNLKEMHFEIAASVFWVANALLYIAADMVRLRNPDDIIH